MDRAERIRRRVDLEFQSLDPQERRRERRRLERRSPVRDEFKRHPPPRFDRQRRIAPHHP
ncbi:hypothetical protein CR158_02225 [Halomonas heilongjiangensis]|uniref:Uncharacterized protein n=2 Tax=Halomonas heilongjiangensis TaxID=1387883 RepID=A0A2N7TLQ9_9GAMM|nr:hypothetical protein C1H66_12075 [Halomonas heilongjiangensis]PXX94148.1 hypothetical protein CR158_02225 [Halomonas heilongjiangensis]